MSSRGFAFSKRAQAKVIDASIFLILSISIIFLIFHESKAVEFDLIKERLRIEYSYRMLLSTLKYKVEKWNMSLSEAIERYFCELKPSKEDVENELKIAFEKIRGENEYIFYASSNDNYLLVYSYKSSICLNKVKLAKLELTTPCNKELNLTLGIFSRYDEVDNC